MPPVDALKQGDRGESVVYPGQLPRELRARPAPTTDQPRHAFHKGRDPTHGFAPTREAATQAFARSWFGENPP
jgi:hypothetical protein